MKIVFLANPSIRHNSLILKYFFTFVLMLFVVTSAFAFGGSGGGKKATAYKGVSALGIHFGGKGSANIDFRSCQEDSETLIAGSCCPNDRVLNETTCCPEDMIMNIELGKCIACQEQNETLIAGSCCPNDRVLNETTCCPENMIADIEECKCAEGYTLIDGLCQIDVCAPYNATGCWICDPVTPTLLPKAEGTPCGGGKECDGAGHCNCPDGYIEEDGTCQLNACANFKQQSGYCIASCESHNGVATYTYDETMCGDYACSPVGICYNPCSRSEVSYSAFCQRCTVVDRQAVITNVNEGVQCIGDQNMFCQQGQCVNLCEQKTAAVEEESNGCKTLTKLQWNDYACDHAIITNVELGTSCGENKICNGNGQCVSTECVDNSTCLSGYFCEYISYDAENCLPAQGICTPLGQKATTGAITNKDQETVFRDVILSKKEMDWWSARNWCQAQDKNLIDISGSKLECYSRADGTTPELITADLEVNTFCCAEGQPNCTRPSTQQSAVMQDLLYFINTYSPAWAWTNVEANESEFVHCAAQSIGSSMVYVQNKHDGYTKGMALCE